MKIQELLEKGAYINVTVNLDDLRVWHREVMEDTRHNLEEAIVLEKAKRYHSPKEVGEMLGVNLSTLWRWKKRGYLVPIEVGGKRKYVDEDINAILKGRQ